MLVDDEHLRVADDAYSKFVDATSTLFYALLRRRQP